MNPQPQARPRSKPVVTSRAPRSGPSSVSIAKAWRSGRLGDARCVADPDERHRPSGGLPGHGVDEGRHQRDLMHGRPPSGGRRRARRRSRRRRGRAATTAGDRAAPGSGAGDPDADHDHLGHVAVQLAGQPDQGRRVDVMRPRARPTAGAAGSGRVATVPGGRVHGRIDEHDERGRGDVDGQLRGELLAGQERAAGEPRVVGQPGRRPAGRRRRRRAGRCRSR